jgi:predicted enzyme related to lactoylglutathione lyase
MTTDPDRSRDFYSNLFGWKAEEANPDFGGYWNFSKDGVLVAGGMRSQNDEAGRPTDFWSIYLATDDAKRTLDDAEANGGHVIVPAMDVADLGTMGVVTDAGGAAIGLWQPGTHKGFGVLAEPNAPSWFELHTRDYDKSIDFYRRVFRWDTHTEGDSPEFKYTTLGEGDSAMAGIMDASRFLPEGVPASWSVYFGVVDADAALAKIKKLGGTVVQPAEDTPYGRLATASDATGANFKLVGSSSGTQ